MYGIEDVVHTFLISVIDILAIFANSMLIFLIKRKTPKDLAPYSILLLNIACVDMFSAFCSALCVPRVATRLTQIVFVHIGPCVSFNARVCHLVFAGFAQCVGLSVILLLISIVYRLLILRAETCLDRVILSRRLQRTAASATAFAAFSMPLFFVAGSYKVPGFPATLTISALDMTVSLSRLCFLTIFIAFVPGLIAIFIVRRRLIAKLRCIRCNRADRKWHKMICRSISAQIILPLAYCCAAVLWLLDVAGIVHCSILQRGVYTVSSLFSLVSPLTNMYYIPPYRRYLNSYFTRESSHISPVHSIEFHRHTDSRY